MRPNVVAFILARGGSERIPFKNVIPLSGIPLIAHTILQAREASLVDRVIVSTDHEGIARVARKYGAETPFMRPEHISGSKVSMNEPLRHGVEWLNDNEGYSADVVVLLKLTTPFREDGIIDKVVSLLLSNPLLETTFAAYPTRGNYWRKTRHGYFQLASDMVLALKDGVREPLWEERHGVALATRKKVVLQNDHYVGAKVDMVECTDARSLLDIDTLYDYWLAVKIADEWNLTNDLPRPMFD